MLKKKLWVTMLGFPPGKTQVEQLSITVEPKELEKWLIPIVNAMGSGSELTRNVPSNFIGWTPVELVITDVLGTPMDHKWDELCKRAEGTSWDFTQYEVDPETGNIRKDENGQFKKIKK